jgi:hypothetical protein
MKSPAVEGIFHRLRCALLGAVVLLAVSGCALVVRGTQQSIRVDAVSSEGKAIDTLECRPGDDAASGPAASTQNRQSVTVRRSINDLLIKCISEGQVVATAKIVSRADLGLISLVVGGMISATIDQLSGAAYAYPSWITLVAGEDRIYDQRDSGDGPSSGTLATPLGAPAPALAAATPTATGLDMRVDRVPNFYRANFKLTARDLREPGARQTGRDTYNVEKLAASMNCSATPRAVLVERGGGFELHQVPCSTGPDLSIRCEYGICRVQQGTTARDDSMAPAQQVSSVSASASSAQVR